MREEVTSFPTDTEDMNPFHLQVAGTSYCDGSYRIERTNSSLFALVYVAEGIGNLEIDSSRFTPQKGDLYILHRGSNHRYSSDACNPWTLIWFIAKGNLVEHLIQAYYLENVHYITQCEVEGLFAEIIALTHSPVQTVRSIDQEASILFHKILLQITSKVEKQDKLLSPEALKMKDYLDGQVEGHMNITDLSRVIFKSPSQAIRLFKRQFGITPYDYFLKRKIESAKMLLESTSIPVKEIAIRLKFADEHYFSNYFKGKIGVSPLAYRKIVQSGNELP